MVLDARGMMLHARIHPIFWFWSWDFVVGSVWQGIAVGGWALRAGGRLAGDLRLRGHGLATQGEGCRAAERQRTRRRGACARGRRGPRPRQGGRARAQGHGASGPRRGRRVIGQAALTGAHRWILHDSLDDWGEADEVLLEMTDQFCAGIQVMEEAALIDHVRSLFGQLGSSTAVVPHDPFLQDPIMKTIVCNSLDVPSSSHLIDLPGSVNTSSPNDDRISHHFRHQMSPASMIQPFHSVQQFYAGATFCCPVTRASCCDFFQSLVQSDHTSIFLLNSQSEGKKSTVQLKNNYSYSEASHAAFPHVSSSLKESNIAISGRRKYLSIEQHGSCMKGGMEITKGDTATSGCTGETCILNKMDAVTSQDHSLDFQTSNATSVNRKFQTMPIADNTKHEDDSFASSDAPFIDSSRYSNCFNFNHILALFRYCLQQFKCYSRSNKMVCKDLILT